MRAEVRQDSFATLMKPFIKEAQRRRKKAAENDPEYFRRLDPELNAHRINFLLYISGETHEPPRTERAFIGTQTIFSYHIPSRRFDLVSLTHDIRAPEIERFNLQHGGTITNALKIFRAYGVGGFELMRQVMENATGLSMDFQVAFKDDVVKEFVDGVFESVEVDVPRGLTVVPFYLKAEKYPEGYFEAGSQEMDGLRVLHYLKGISTCYDRSVENNQRKVVIFKALFQSLKENSDDLVFWLRTSRFLTERLFANELHLDFYVQDLLLNNVDALVAGLREVGRSDSELIFPEIRKSLYIVDGRHGDGGVRWVRAEASVNPIVKREIDEGVYPDFAIEVPEGGNPKAGDLVAGYWPSVRNLVSKALK
ncbi:MAG: LCP family protein [Chloroflexi bacterium]|nr:LCP family protein [Chloroflexota bacterium]